MGIETQERREGVQMHLPPLSSMIKDPEACDQAGQLFMWYLTDHSQNESGLNAI